jgi:hypothetical protein
LQKADVFTKPFTDANKWNTRLVEIGIWYPGTSSKEFEAVAKSKPNKEKTANSSQANASAVPAIQDVSQKEDRLKHSNKSMINKRTIIEFCCGKDSKLGQTNRIRAARGCNVIRITEEHDVTTQEGFDYVNKIIDECHGPSTMLMAAMPCTGGSQWGNINAKKPGGAAR